MRIIEHNGYKIRAETDAGIYKATIIKDNKELSKSQMVYFKTTNEMNVRKSVILDAIYTLITRRREKILNTYLQNTGTTRITKKKKDTLYNKDNELLELLDLYEYFKQGDI